MSRIVLTEDQARLLNPLEVVEICDPAGRVVATVPPDLTPEQVARIKRSADSPGPRLTGEQVGQGLRALDEAWQREGPFDLARARHIVRAIGEPGRA